MSSAFELRPAGAITYWAGTETKREELLEHLAIEGHEHRCPQPRSAEACLKAALLRYCADQRANGCGCIVLPHSSPDSEGFELRNVTHRDKENDVEFIASIAPEHTDGNGNALDAPRLKLTAGHLTDDQLLRIDGYFRHELSVVTGAQIGTMLIRAVESLGGVCLRPGGALYYLPDAALPVWKTLVRAIEATGQGGNRVYFVRTLLDASGARAVRDAIVAEARSAVAELEDGIKSGDLGERALKNRAAVAHALRAKVEQYESILGEALTAVKDAIDTAEQAAVVALSTLEGTETYQGLASDPVLG